MLRDNTQYTKKSLDLYVAGFPCTSFTGIGKMQGFNDDVNGIVFFHVYDFIFHNRPNIFILENVRNLMGHDKGNTFKIIMQHLNDLKDYNIVYKVLNAMDYGLPQSRNRIFIIGIKRTVQKKSFKFPLPEPSVYADSLISKHLPKGNGLTDRQLSIIKYIHDKYPKVNLKSDKPLWILQLDVSQSRFRLGTQGISPCLVTRCNYYIPKYERFLTGSEALSLQGIPHNIYDFNLFYF